MKPVIINFNLLYCSGPTKPGNITVMTPGTDNLNVQWTLLEGGFDHFMVNISNQELDYSNSSRTTNKTANFTNLHSGRIFVITVTAVAGNFSNSSEPSSFATSKFPTYFPAYCSRMYSRWY